MGIRSFLAFEVPRNIRNIVSEVSNTLRESSLDIKWVRTEHAHVTVIFIGSVHEGDIATIKEIAGGVSKNFGSFKISLNGIGLFPQKRRPRVLWIGLTGDISRMASFRDVLQDAMMPIGVRRESAPFRPHLTLGRFRKKSREGPLLEETLSQYKMLASPVGSIEELILFKSDLNPGGAVYTKLASFPLLGRL